jgi:hypothetical protein
MSLFNSLRYAQSLQKQTLQNYNNITDDKYQNNIKIQCQPCSKSFTSYQTLQKHTNSNVKCKLCPFEALAKIVEQHFEHVHTKPKIIPVANPDEVQDYISARRNKFPSVQNVKRKEIETELKRQRGDVIDLEIQPKLKKNRTKTKISNDVTKPITRRRPLLEMVILVVNCFLVT